MMHDANTPNGDTAMSKRTLSAKVNGVEFTRTSAADYTHAVGWSLPDGRCGVSRWCKSLKNAQDAAYGFRNHKFATGEATYYIVDVETA